MDSEKPTTKKEGSFYRFLYNDKLPPVLTFFSAVIAFSLSLVAFLSGAEKGQLQEYEVVIVRTYPSKYPDSALIKFSRPS